MPFVSVTRLHLRSVRFLPAFAFHTWRTLRQLRMTPGFLAGRLAAGGGSYWTLTLWESDAAMRSYRNSGAHRRAMPRLVRWCDEASVAHWTQAEVEVCGVGEASRRLGAAGRLLSVRHPSPAHARGEAWPGGRVPRPGPAVAPHPAGGRSV